MSADTPTEIANKLYTVLLSANKADPSLTDEAINGMLEYAFGHIHMLKGLSEKQRITAVWHLVELGGLPLIINLLDPEHRSQSMGMTMVGMLFKDENLLSHKLGKKVLANEKFLPAIEGGLKSTKDEMMPLLVGQVLHNVMRTASSEHLKQMAEFGDLVKLTVSLFKANVSNSQDWRLSFVTTDMLLLWETANAHAALQEHDHAGAVMQLLEPNNRQLLEQHEPLMNRALALLFLWAMRTRHTKDAAVAAKREKFLGLVKELKKSLPEAFQTPEEVDGKKPPTAHQSATTVNICIALDELVEGKESTIFPLHLTLKSRVRNWDAIEKDAEKKVRSPEFEKMVNEQKKMKEQAEQLKKGPVVDISSDESSDDDDDDDDDGERRKDEAPPASKAIVASDSSSSPTLATKATEITATEENGQTPRQQTKQEIAGILQEATIRKTQGTTYFRGNMFEDAKEIYQEALEVLERVVVDDEDVNNERAKLYGNCAECCLRLSEYSEAMAMCNACLQRDPTFMKAYFRRAKANKALGDVEAALADVRKALGLDPTNKPAIKLLRELKKGEAASTQDETSNSSEDKADTEGTSENAENSGAAKM